MSDSCKPPDLVQVDTTDDEDLYVPSGIDKGKRRAEGGFFSHDGGHFQSTTSARFSTQTVPQADDAGSDSDVSLYESLDSASDDQIDAGVPVPQHHELDLAYSVKGMYRILDLITEQGNGGLVDKIIISQNSLEAFITTVDPGACASMTKVNFKVLDNYIIKPVGVYGSKEEIVRFLSELGVIDDPIATQLLVDTETDSPTTPTLRSGLYIIRTTEQTGNIKQIFVLYWPEPGTWDDSAALSIRHHRVTFMRYLTKMCDQVVALISSEHAQTIVWNENDEDDNDTLEVDQEESVTVREGFKVASDRITLLEANGDGLTNNHPVKPFLLFGEASQGLMTVRYQEARLVADTFRARTYNPLQLEGYLRSDCLHLSESLDDEGLRMLVRSGLGKRFPQECNQWKHESNAVQELSRSRAEAEIARTQAKLQDDYPNLGRFLHQAISSGERAVQSPEPLSKLIATGIEREYASLEEEEQRKLRADLIRRLNNMSKQTPHTHVLHITAVEQANGSHYFGSSPSTSYRISGSRESQEDPMVIYTVYLMNHATQDQHELELNPTTISSPRFKFTHSFKLPQGHSVVRAQLLEDDKLLLVVADRNGNLTVYLEGLAGVDGAIQRGRGKALNREKVGQDFLLAYDESKRMLGVVSSDRLLLHIFVFDDARGFQALGSSTNLTAWYNEGSSIRHACFISGTEELLLVDSQAQARVFSLPALRFRPTTLNLDHVPLSVSSTPDGSCLLVAQARGSEMAITAYQWDTFGFTEGIALDIPNLHVGDNLLVTSLISRSAAHLVTLDFLAHTCQSYALGITRRVMKFVFKERGVRGGTATRSTNTTAHNCIIDCHSEVWTRFPVLPAVQRETISSSSLRNPRTLVFVTDRDFPMFASHFTKMIHTFECATMKPTGDILKSIRVSAASFSVFCEELCGGRPWNVSQYRAGEWVADFFCLIPIQIAIAKQNRFIPLKDGVYSTDLEESLLGADVNRIVDSLSFGWYESIFQSYMASKPVKVVSSMGEQSVGKSFALNHLVDTSFGGSATRMRTTEGVWMSVTPTEEALIVALDFEGIHGIERSVQEDTLLISFNTAISNLVLFRNNFALSRDITGLFQSFQSSSTFLDPKENPSLFQSTLVIIIKDVLDSDKAEMTKEFSFKLQGIVQDEQDANFISRLHCGKLSIIPWPVIDSKEFYRLFPAVKRRLDQQVVTHRTAREFLHAMKTLMGKLKANDGRAMSETMASHRAQLISTLLPNALTFGLAEIDPEREPLKNLDTDSPVNMPDTPHQLFIAGGGIEQSASRECTLAVLRAACDLHESRQYSPEEEWIEGLTNHLETIVNLRIDHVREWLTVNVSRFQAGHASIEELRRAFENAIVDLKNNVQLCKLPCASCQLFCVQGRLHDGPHHCQTDHLCVHGCELCMELSGEHKQCAMTAAHAGRHICTVNEQLCGEPCKFAGRRGCLNACTKMINHPHSDEGHLCAAPVHACGNPCDVSGVKLIDGSTYSCPGRCRFAGDVGHSRHECDTQICYIPCQLCEDLCSHQDHMHALEPGAIHLCGQEHSCNAVCSAPGICEISAAPQSIDAIFRGRNETFQYTNVAQVAKRLKCIKPIAPGARQHRGSHSHSLNRVIHFCEARCDGCGHFCTLPLGHPQQEHDTRHGSMSRTRWAVGGPDDVALEIRGRKFSTNDEGTPMMCNLVCQEMGRHVHIDYCRADEEANCTGNDQLQHLTRRVQPNPDRAKDLITHNLFWKRNGFKDPYSKREQENFAKCDAMCSGPEHNAAGGNLALPSYCILPLFHPPMNPDITPAGMGYISRDGHQFHCRHPVVVQQAFHVIFVVDRSGSMSLSDRKPLANTPAAARIRTHSDNRFGVVLSSLYNFWTARAAAIASSQARERDSYSVVLFNPDLKTPVVNNFASTPDQLLDILLPFEADGDTELTTTGRQIRAIADQFWSTSAIRQAQAIMEQNWSTKRSPAIIFLSGNECQVADHTMQDLCRTAVRLGKAVSFHSVSFGPDASSHYLRRMAEIALDAQNNAPRDPLAPAAVTVLSSHTEALDTVRLAEICVGITDSLRKQRGALLRSD